MVSRSCSVFLEFVVLQLEFDLVDLQFVEEPLVLSR